MNNLDGIHELSNRYFLMRHGKSVPNEAGRIVSKPENGTQSVNGLVEEGRRQVELSLGTIALKHSDLPYLHSWKNRPWLIYSSDFSRTLESAAIARKRLGATVVHWTKLLRERDFGDLELHSTEAYDLVWERDKQKMEPSWGVEPVEEVQHRTSLLVVKNEYRTQNHNILLVSHGDPLQILETAFYGMDPSTHRSLPPLELGEIRQINLRR